MAIREQIRPERKGERGNLVEMSWDPITRIIGNLGIYTKIDFDNQEVVECKSTSNMFRGYSVFMRGKDPRDARADPWRQSHHLLRIRAEYGVWNKESADGRVDFQSGRSR